MPGTFKINKFKLSIILPYFIICAVVFAIFSGFFIQGRIFLGNNDRVENTVPFKLISLRAFQNHALPQWNPYIFCGASYLGSGVVQFFYPFEAILYFFPEKAFPYLLTVSMIIHALLAGIFAFIFLNETLNDRYWATLSTLTYMISASLISVMKAGARDFSPFTFLPLCLYLIKTSARRKAAVNFIFFSITAYLIISGGNPQNSFYVILLASFYALYESFKSKNNRVAFGFKNLSVNILGILTALGMSAMIIVTFIYANKDTCSGAATYAEFLRYSKVETIDLMRLFAHKFLGRFACNPLTGLKAGSDIFTDLNVFYPATIFANYAGIPAIIFSLYAILFIRSRETLFWGVSSAVIILSLTQTPLNYLFYLLNGKTLVLAHHLGYLLPMCFSVLFGITGVHALKHHVSLTACHSRMATGSLPDKNRPWAGIFCFSAYLCIAVIAMLTFFYSYARARNVDAVILSMMSSSLDYFLIFSLLTLGAVYLFRRNAFPAFSKTVFFLIVITDLSFIANFELRLDRVSFCAPAPLFKLQETKAWQWSGQTFISSGRKIRFLFGTKSLPTNQSISPGIYNSSGYTSLSPANIARIFYYPDTPNRINARSIWPRTSRACALSSTKAFIMNDKIIPIKNEILLRATLFSRYKVIPEEEAALKETMRPGFDIFNAVILESEPGINIPDAAVEGRATIIKDMPEHISVEVNSGRNCILLLTDTYAKGWEVSVDKKKQRLIRANFAFRAVAVPSGQHIVEFSYRHPGLDIAIIITVLSWLILLIAVVSLLLRMIKNIKSAI